MRPVDGMLGPMADMHPSCNGGGEAHHGTSSAGAQMSQPSTAPREQQGQEPSAAAALPGPELPAGSGVGAAVSNGLQMGPRVKKRARKQTVVR